MKKQEIQELLNRHSEEIDLEQLMDELYVRAKLEQAEAAISAGDVVSHEDVLQRNQSWFR